MIGQNDLKKMDNLLYGCIRQILKFRELGYNQITPKLETELLNDLRKCGNDLTNLADDLEARL